MQLNVTTLIYWKKDHNAQTNEDALDLDVGKGLYVVCDGVGEASFSNEWAPVLARSFIERPIFSEDQFEVEHWTRAAQARALPVMTDPESLSGVSREKARRGAAATLCGMVLVPRQEYDGIHYGYNLTAIGDSNFFHWRPDQKHSSSYKLIAAFPLKAYADFNSSPDSLNSRVHNRDNISVHTFSSTPDLDLREGDIIFLATDAVSQWIFREYEAALAGEPTRHPMPFLLSIVAQHDEQPGIEPPGTPWANFIDTLREGNNIVDDDSIMIVLRVNSLSKGSDLRPLDAAPRIKERTRELLDAIGRWLTGGAVDGKPEVRDVDIAVAYGDGTYIDTAIRSRLSTPARFRVQGSDSGTFRAGHMDLWRGNADSFKRITDGVRAVMRGDADPRQRDEIKLQLEDIWDQVSDQLAGLSWMQGLVKTLKDMGVEQKEEPGKGDSTDKARLLGADGKSSSVDAKTLRHGTEQVYKAIGDWITGRGSDANIIKAFDANPHIDPSFAAAIATPVAVEGGLVSHIDIWRAQALGGDAPTTVPPRKQVVARTKTVVEEKPDDAVKPPAPLPPRPGITGNLPPSPPKSSGDAPIPAPKQSPLVPPLPPPSSPSLPSSPPSPSGTPGTTNPAPQQGGQSVQSAQAGQARQTMAYSQGYMPMQPQSSNRTLLWAVGGAALLGVILLAVALVFVFAPQPSPGPVTPTPGVATSTPSSANATATALALVNNTATPGVSTPTVAATATPPAKPSPSPTIAAGSSSGPTPRPTFPSILFPFITPTSTAAPAPGAPANPTP